MLKISIYSPDGGFCVTLDLRIQALKLNRDTKQDIHLKDVILHYHGERENSKNYMPVNIAIYTVKRKDISFSVTLLGKFLIMQKGI